MKRFYKCLLLFCLILCCSLLPAVTAEASGINPADGLNSQTEAPAKYMNDSYRDNYYLDIEDVGLLEKQYSLFNHVANGIFSFIKFIAYATINFFYHSLTFDVTTSLANELNSIQSILKNSIFEPLLFLGFFFSGVTILKRFMQRNMVGIFSEFCKVIVIILISIFLANDSKTILTVVSSITKSISLSAFTGVNSLESDPQATLQDYASESAGILWQNMLHEPWKSLEFGNFDFGSRQESVEEEFLTIAPGIDERKELVEKYSYIPAFYKFNAITRVANSIIYLVIIIIKCVLYIAVTGIMFVYQIFSIFYMLIAPLILILAFFPSYQGIVNVWFKKFLEVQVCIFIITLILGLIVKLDSIIFQYSGSMGWFMALMFQIVTIYFLYKERDKIIHAFSNVQKAVEIPAYANAMLRNSMNAQNLPKTVNRIKNMPKNTINDARNAVDNVKNAAAHTKEALSAASARVTLGMSGMGWTKSGMEKRAEEASVRQNLRRMALQNNRPDLYKSMQEQEKENERMKNLGPIKRHISMSNKTLAELRAYEREKERAERNATKSERSVEASEGYSNIVKFEDRPRLQPNAEEAVNMRSYDDKTITAPAIERPILDRSETIASVSPQNAPISSLESGTPQITPSNVSVQNKGIQSAREAVPRSTRQASRQNIPRAAGSFTAVETNVPVNAGKQKAERPKLNTGQYKETEASGSKQTAKPKQVSNAKQVSKPKTTAPQVAGAKKIKK